MRKPERIDLFLDILGDIWKKQPELRFGQMICLAFCISSKIEYDGRLWHVEDDDFLERLMENMSIEIKTTKEEAQQTLSMWQSAIRGRVMDLDIFEGEDWRWEEYLEMEGNDHGNN